MAGSTFGKQFKITTWGESHGAGVGVVIDGCPAGLSLSSEDIQLYLNRRKPGQSRFTTPRKEDDAVEILSGVFEGKTTGTPISLVVYNRNQKSKDYSEIAACYRPGHADYTFDAKYDFRDYRGGGRSSGRETIGRVAAGEPILAQQNIEEYFPLPASMLPNKQTYILEVKGESMINAGILSGDYVLVQEERTASNGDMVVALIEDGATVKTFYREEGVIRLQPENDFMDPIILKDVTILGKVIGVMRFFK